MSRKDKQYSEAAETTIIGVGSASSIESKCCEHSGQNQIMFNFKLLCAVLLLITTAVTVTATDHIVGANRGWNPGINYTLWANNQTFYVGDFISFRYQKTQYNVFEVNQTGYDNCTTQGALGNWTSGKDFILLNKTGRYYFICGNGQCFNGMKVSVLVHPLPSPPTSSPSNRSSHKSASPPLFQRTLHSLVLSSSAIAWFACWI